MGNQLIEKKYGVLIGEAKTDICGKPVETKVLRSAELGEGDLVQTITEGITNLWDNFLERVKEFKNEPLLGTRRVEETGEGPKLGGYEWMSYKETEDIVNNLARGFLDKNLCPKVEGDPQFENTREMRFLGIYAKNRAEWVLCDQAMMAISGTTIPYYDTLGEPAIYYITELTQLSTIALTSECLPRIISYKLDPVGHHKMRTLKNLLIMDKLEEGMEEEARAAGLSIFHFHDLLDAGRQSTSSLIPATRSTVASICFTSGTTGNPKGVIITHGNLLGCVAGIVKTKWYSASAEDRYLSYLPLAHMWERLMVQVNITRGVSIGFYNGNVFKLKEDLAALKPSLMISVPRLYYRFYDVIKNKIQETSGVKRMLIDRALKVKLENLRKTGETKHYLYDKLVFNQMKKVLGGNVRTMCSGSAPIAPEVLDFLKICFCAPICEGYGQTESCAGGCVTVDDDHFSGHCGSPWLCQEIKLVDIPHLHYFATDSDAYGKPAPRGEICLRGTNITQGYFKTPDKTKETIDSDGWLHTGDVGIFLQGGRLKIIDRISNCFKLQQGEYIAAEKLENVYIKCPYLAQIFVYGDGMRNYLVALGTLDRENVFKWAKQTEFVFEEKENKSLQLLELTQSSELKKVVLESLLYLHHENKFNSLEKIQKVELLEEEFTQENGLLTPTFKLKRNVAKKIFAEDIEKLYLK